MDCSRKSITQRCAPFRLIHLFNKHAVSVRIKAVALGNRMFVSAEHVFFSAESADQHEQRGLRQMKVGQHRFDYFELEARINEKISHARPGGDGPSSGPHCMFEGSNRGSANRNDSTPR